MLADTGPLVGITDRNDTHHAVCQSILRKLREPLETTWPCFTEAMYLLGKADGTRSFAAQRQHGATGRCPTAWTR